MDINTICLYHNDKLAFQQLSRDIQHAKLIPRPYVYRLGMAVCSCRRKKPDIKGLLQSSDLHIIISSVQEKLHSNEEQKFLKNFLNSEVVKGISTDNYSLCMFLYVLYQSYKNNTYNFLQGTSPAVDRPKKVKVEKTNKQKVKQMVVQKRMKTLKSKQECKMKIFPGNLLRLKDTEGFKKLLYQYRKDIVLKFNKEANERTFTSKIAITHVILHYKDVKMLATFRSKLWSAAEEIQKEMDNRHSEQRRSYGQRIIYDKEVLDHTATACAVKETRQTDYIKKLKKRGWTPQTPSPLIDGQCFNCLGTFEGLKDAAPCQHHPGYLKNEVWTCCGEKAMTAKPCHKDHQETGCVVGIHNWRQRKTGGRKLDSYTRYTTAEDYKLSRACVKPNFHGHRIPGHHIPGHHVVNLWDYQLGIKN
ncbi:uncharacterized protein LOC132556628 [Ylistrum balloti]|uniref:uncharacterized protein LOC132556628 n=1 Tax=Ylistrum balloti TaxID=509963 RepID=UPI002905BDF7|nr:uncharacterized protein LOC132556628 [Ylistrum balloti]